MADLRRRPHQLTIIEAVLDVEDYGVTVGRGIHGDTFTRESTCKTRPCATYAPLHGICLPMSIRIGIAESAPGDQHLQQETRQPEADGLSTQKSQSKELE